MKLHNSITVSGNWFDLRENYLKRGHLGRCRHYSTIRYYQVYVRTAVNTRGLILKAGASSRSPQPIVTIRVWSTFYIVVLIVAPSRA